MLDTVDLSILFDESFKHLVFYLNASGQVTSCNPAASEFRSRCSSTGKFDFFIDCFNRNETDLIKHQLNEAKTNADHSTTFALYHAPSNNQINWQISYSPEKQVFFVFGFVFKSEEKLDSIYSSNSFIFKSEPIIPIEKWSFNCLTKELIFSENIRQTLNLDGKDSDTYKRFITSIPSNQLDHVKDIFDNPQNYINGFEVYYGHQYTDTRIVTIKLTGVVTIDQNGEPTSISGLIKDNTSAFINHRKLAKSEELLNAAQSISQLGSWSFNLATEELYWSNELYKIFDIPKRDYKDLYKEYISRISEEDVDLMEDLIEVSIQKGSQYTIEHSIQLPDGTKKWVKEIGLPIYSENGKAIRLEGICQDITELKQTQLIIERNIHEKETLIKEIHHRVKNNMQVISSLINLQSHYIKDPKILLIFKDCQNRIKSMGTIHNMLYVSDNMAELDLSSYVTELLNDLIRSFKGGNSNIDYQVKINDVKVNVDTAVPLGLILNEVITNTLKHAFVDNRAGKIEVEYCTDSNSCLLIRDNGPGFDIQKARSMDTLGMQLIEDLSDQLNGEVQFESSPLGTTFRLTFKQ